MKMDCLILAAIHSCNEDEVQPDLSETSTGIVDHARHSLVLGCETKQRAASRGVSARGVP